MDVVGELGVNKVFHFFYYLIQNIFFNLLLKEYILEKSHLEVPALSEGLPH